jgi:hypothetical protein
MKFISSALLFTTAVLPLSSAHYTFSGLVVNDQQVGSDWQYIRQHTRGYMPTMHNEILENDFRCNKGASSGANTEVYTVKTGDKVALKQAFGGTGMKHPGPTQVYMSQAPSGVKNYDGSGDWFKVFEGLLCKQGSASALQNDAWCMYGEDRIEFTIPSNIPNGEYLVRAEHIAVHGAHDGNAEFYYSCAQVKVTGGSGSSIPQPKVKIPGVYKPTDPAVNFSVWGDKTSYPTIPGPEVVKGGQTRGSTTGSTSSIATVKRDQLVTGDYSGSLAARARAVISV